MPRAARRLQPELDAVVQLSPEWLAASRSRALRYFMPDCDDRVDPGFDFLTDTHSGGRGCHGNEVYAHQLYPTPNYDGILVSKAVAEDGKEKAEAINRLGVHRYLRVPAEVPVLGDCGAFSYSKEADPPYTTPDMLDYYTRLRFNQGVSIDHIAVVADDPAEQVRRVELTLHNAEEFLREHRKRGLPWTPVGAVQGTDPQGYAMAAKRTAAMGYKLIALGGLVAATTERVLAIAEAVHAVLPPDVALHLFGLARVEATHDFIRFGVRQVDSASPLRRAWTDARANYYGLDGETYAAVRVPVAKAGPDVQEKAARLEQACLSGLRAYDAGLTPLGPLLDTLDEYEALMFQDRKPTRKLVERTLTAQPWKRCPCVLCQRHGVEVLIFRGNNRNRRRGFHNTWVFYQRLGAELARR